MLRIGSIVIRVDDLERQAAFWCAALGYERTARWDRPPADADHVILADPEGNRFCVIDAGTGTGMAGGGGAGGG